MEVGGVGLKGRSLQDRGVGCMRLKGRSLLEWGVGCMRLKGRSLLEGEGGSRWCGTQGEVTAG